MSAALTWLCFPPFGASYIVLGFNVHYRGFYSSAWIGMVLAMVSIWLSLIGFYLVRGTLRNDIESNLWQLLVATPLSRSSYLLAKWCGHMAVLLLIMGAGLLAGLLAQCVRAEVGRIDLVELIKPSLVIGLPSLALSATLAIWFDMVPWLRRSAGNVLYFVVWLLILIGSGQALGGKEPPGLLSDPRGMKIFDYTAHQVLLVQTGKDAKPGFCMGCGLVSEPAVRLDWDTWQVPSQVLLGRLGWLALSVLGVAVCAPWLDRAAASRAGAGVRDADDSGRQLRWLNRILSPLQRSRFGALLAAELLLTLRPRRLWWWCAVVASAVAQLLAPAPSAAIAVICAWLLSIDIYARVGLREQESRSAPVVLSSVHGGSGIVLARWLSLLLIGGVTTLPALLRFALEAPLSAVAIAVVGMSLASWGLASAVVTRTGRVFEGGLCLLGYLGLQDAPVLHVLIAPAWTISVHLALLPLAALSLLIAWPRLYTRVGPGMLLKR